MILLFIFLLFHLRATSSSVPILTEIVLFSSVICLYFIYSVEVLFLEVADLAYFLLTCNRKITQNLEKNQFAEKGLVHPLLETERKKVTIFGLLDKEI
jgi:hypothetical protein